MRNLYAFISLLLIVGCSSKGVGPVQVKTVDKMQVLFVERKGDFSEIGNIMGMIFKYAGEKGFQVAGAPMGIYYDDPKKVAPEECRYEVCIPVTPIIDSLIKTDSLMNVLVKGDSNGIKIKELPPMEVVYVVHKGSYSKVGPAWGSVYKWVYRNRYKPDGAGREVYLNSPEGIPEDSLLTEIQIPVKK